MLTNVQLTYVNKVTNVNKLTKGAVKYCLKRRTTADSAFPLSSTNVQTESQPIVMQNQLLSFSPDNT